MRYAVIIKHPYRNNDWRVDIVDVDEDIHPATIRTVIERTMLGPSEVISVTPKISNRDISDSLGRLSESTENHIDP